MGIKTPATVVANVSAVAVGLCLAGQRTVSRLCGIAA